MLFNKYVFLYKYGWYKQKSIWRNDIETIADSDGILWLNEKHIEEGLDYKHLRVITIKHHPNHRTHKYELVDKPKKPM